MNVAVVGGGIFGTTIAMKLSESGHKIDLYEMNGQILSCASMVNQFRMHRGYHYPRSKDTALGTKNGFESFRKLYGVCLLERFDHYYCIAKRGSLTSPEQFVRFCKDLGLEYQIINPPKIVNEESISLCVKVKESILSPSKLLKVCQKELVRHQVKVHFKKFYPSQIRNYDLVVNVTYAYQNYLLEKTYPEKMVDYQFEVVEKLVLRLPVQYKDLSVVVIDGPFTCIDPFDETGNHLMGNVETAIFSRNIGKYPRIPKELAPFLNKGIVKQPTVTRFNDFVTAAKPFFSGIEKAKHAGSMFTVRTVYPRHEHDDARPTDVRRIGDKIISVFSGKIPTCVSAADKVADMVHQRINP